jgi:hypothetical protein
MHIMLWTLLHNLRYLHVALTRRKNGWGLVTGGGGCMGRKSTFTSYPVRIFVVNKEALGEVFLLVLRSSTVNNIPPLAPYVSSSTCCSYQKDKREKPRNLPIRSVLSEVGEYCTRRIEGYFQLFHFCTGLPTQYIACNSCTSSRGRRRFYSFWRLRVQLSRLEELGAHLC